MTAKSSDWRPGPSVCRCCFAEGCYKDISTEYFWMGKREVYQEMLSTTFDVSISYAQSGGPNSNSRLICEPCIARLRDASDFKRQVQECERVFHQHLDPTSSVSELEAVVVEPPGKEVKLERVKVESKLSDDEDFDDHAFVDDDDDDLDDQPLTALATKVPKKESVDLMDLLDNAKPEKRKAAAKPKTPPAKKAKKKESPKPSASKPAPKPVEKKRKECDANYTARRNAKIIVEYSTAYPFRLPEESMVCVYCCDSYDDPSKYREHMDTEHKTVNVRIAFHHLSEGYIKVDCTDLRCRLCVRRFDDLNAVANHLFYDHQKKLDLNQELGLQPFVIYKDKLQCAMCKTKSISIRQLSRHTQKHFLKYTCESCGKSYPTVTSLNSHVRLSHSSGSRICRKCKTTFSTLEEKRQHLIETPKCWPYVCGVCYKRFVSWTIKQMHIAEVHGAPKKTFPCPECSEVFLDRKKYRSHFKLVHTEDSFMCSYCDLKFDSKRGLEDHKVVHTKEKLFPCTVCSKSFGTRRNLNQHMWIHKEVKRFGCSTCNKVFNQRVSWRTHMRSHHPDVVVDFDDWKKNNFKYPLLGLKNNS
ncbi:zinc finger protein 808-like isoform X10 [Pectinophora gossypiella]|uniref:zinc finger protein 808-like isoform X10 n=1 Tax=Pectinophora gossypiella TaxID=13191 RepID=UPI00214E4F36|nr:zinc finger protein 808-like isoform X10 [Pectinophora gossypiella]